MGKSIIKDKLEELIFLKSQYENELKRYPPGKLSHVFEKKKYHRYFYVTTQKRTGKRIRRRITRNKKVLIAMARKAFLQETTKQYDNCIRQLKKVADLPTEVNTREIVETLQKKYPQIPAGYFLSPSTNLNQFDGAGFAPNGVSQQVFEWANQPYNKNPQPFANELYTSKHLRVRSKNELLIIEKLYHYGIPFRYEQIINLDGVTLSPDITLRNNLGETIYWEHFGMMHSEDYQKTYFNKRHIYERNGYNMWDNLICTFSEENDLDLAEIDSIIQCRLLPWLVK